MNQYNIAHSYVSTMWLITLQGLSAGLVWHAESSTQPHTSGRAYRHIALHCHSRAVLACHILQRYPSASLWLLWHYTGHVECSTQMVCWNRNLEQVTIHSCKANEYHLTWSAMGYKCMTVNVGGECTCYALKCWHVSQESAVPLISTFMLSQ